MPIKLHNYNCIIIHNYTLVLTLQLRKEAVLQSIIMRLVLGVRHLVVDTVELGQLGTRFIEEVGREHERTAHRCAFGESVADTVCIGRINRLAESVLAHYVHNLGVHNVGMSLVNDLVNK